MTSSACKVCGRTVTYLWWSCVHVNRVTLWCWQCSSCWIEHDRRVRGDQ